MRNRPLLESIVQMRQDALRDYDVKTTPSFVINNETTISGFVSFEEFAEKLTPLLPDSDFLHELIL